MGIDGHWAANGKVRLHYLDTGTDGGTALPVLFVPGVSDTAEEYADVVEFFQPRRALVMDLRGRGRSDAPEEGYTFAELVGDVEAVVAAAAIERLHLMTF